ncbi:MAG: hypothetical protein R3C05_16500 [Pirellulaceae bacterium]
MINDNTAVTGGGVYNDAAAETDTQTFSFTFTALNDSGVTGTGSIIVSSPTADTRSVRVIIDAEGLEDLTSFGGIHVAHIHGQFAGNASRPLLQQGDGPFFEGDGGTPVDSVLPSVAADDGTTIEDGFLDFLEGRPKYGPVVLNLTSTQLRDAQPGGSNPPDGTPPLTHFLNLAGSGQINPASLFPSGTEFNLDTTYTFDMTNPDEERQFNNLTPLNLREVVLHGQTIDKSISDAIDAAAMGTAPAGVDVGGGEAFRVTAPVAAAEIRSASGSITIKDATISGNTATGDAATDGGGGIHNENGTVTIVDTVISDNKATGSAGSGGGIINVGGTVNVEGGAIRNNVANRAGGGIETTAGSTVTLHDVRLTSNSAGVGAGLTAAPGNGGGLHVTGDGTVQISDSFVGDNDAALEGGGLWNGSGFMSIDATTIVDNTASGPAADDGGGGVFNNGGELEITDSVVRRNTADGASGSGGGILNLGGMLTVNGGSISGNFANRAGGGIETTGGSTVSLNDVTIDNNSLVAATAAPGNGGGVHVGGDGKVTVTGGSVSGNEAVEGGGLWNSGSGTLVIDGTVINDNTAVTGGGVYNDAAAETDTQTFSFTFTALNDSGVTGTGSIIVSSPTADTRSVRVIIDAEGLEDLTSFGGITSAYSRPVRGERLASAAPTRGWSVL